jgi:type IX secretion system PorP/SprF family membrane protein
VFDTQHCLGCILRKNVRTVWLTLISTLFVSVHLFAQDPQFSQYYSAPLYLNPAFAGSTGCTRLVSIYRNQWYGLGKPYNTFAFSADHHIEKLRSGVGVQFLNDRIGTNGISSTEVSLYYAYRVNLSKKYSLRAGVQLGYASKYLDIMKLYFPDQYTDEGQTGSASEDYYNKRTRSNYLDISTGLLFYSKHFWLGVAGHHVNEPNQSFGTNGSVARLPMKWSLQTGYLFVIGQGVSKPYDKSSHGRTSLTPTLLFKHQGAFNQLDLGIFLTHKPWFVGLWYRGIPVMKTVESYTNNDAIVVQAGIRFERFNLGYSYDYSISKLRTYSRGSHEVTLGIVFCSKKNCKPKERLQTLPCPDFYNERLIE